MTEKEERGICQAGRRNQVVEKKARMLANFCNSSKSEGKKKKDCQVGTGQSSRRVQGRPSPYAIVGGKKIKEV